jgi:hypothetical protein
VDDGITVHPPPESCTGIISDLAYGSLLWGQPRIFGPSRQLNGDWQTGSADRAVCGIRITAKYLWSPKHLMRRSAYVDHQEVFLWREIDNFIDFLQKNHNPSSRAPYHKQK